jgi:hypothetical protein
VHQLKKEDHQNPKMESHARVLGLAAASREMTSKQAVFTTDTYEGFKNIVPSFRKRHCKDDRDRFYGMLGFRPWDVEIPVIIDHSRTVEEVYTGFARAMLKHKNLAIFGDAGIWNRCGGPTFVMTSQHTQDAQDLPSWVLEHRLSKLKTAISLPWPPTIGNQNWSYCPPIIQWQTN